ncbi:hypothetical protein GF377_05050 [candidate division GN15 bacterium]|nr:hypothetical protein [candidate division GN15 bacterium]
MLAGKKVLLPHSLISEINWNDSQITADATTEKIVNAPPFDPEQPVKREYEVVLHDHYSLNRYWGPEK